MTQPIDPGYQIPNYWPHGYWQVGNQYWPTSVAVPPPPPPVRPPRVIGIPDFEEMELLNDDDEVLVILCGDLRGRFH